MGGQLAGGAGLLQGSVGMGLLQAGRWWGRLGSSGGRVAPERLLSPTRWHWEPCDAVPVPVPQHSLACPCPTPGAEHRGTRARCSIPVPLGAGVTEERGVPTCPVLHTPTWPLQES